MSLLPKPLQNIRGFPTLQVVKKGKVVKEYQGERGHQAIVNFAKEQVSPKKAVSAPTVATKKPTHALPKKAASAPPAAKKPTLKKKKVKPT